MVLVQGDTTMAASLKELAFKFTDCEFLYPVHLNPNVQNPAKDILGKEGLSNVHLIEPLEYLPFVYLMNRAYFIISDSGGVQEEAPSLGKPVLITRNITERPEGVVAGVARLTGNKKKDISKEVSLLISSTVTSNEDITALEIKN